MVNAFMCGIWCIMCFPISVNFILSAKGRPGKGNTNDCRFTDSGCHHSAYLCSLSSFVVAFNLFKSPVWLHQTWKIVCWDWSLTITSHLNSGQCSASPVLQAADKTELVWQSSLWWFLCFGQAERTPACCGHTTVKRGVLVFIKRQNCTTWESTAVLWIV